MYSIYPTIQNWSKENKTFALAAIVKTWGSSPRTVGAKMAVSEDGDITGSVSGGCVEGAVVAASMETLKTGNPQLLHFDVADDTAMNVGLACGGELDVFVSLPSQDFLFTFSQAYSGEHALTHITLIEGEPLGQEIFLMQNGDIKGSISKDADLEILQHLPNQTQQITLRAGSRAFIDVIKPPTKLVIVGGVHIAVALSRIAKASGYRVVLVDPRRQFSTQIRFPEADQILHLWPNEAFDQLHLSNNTAVVFLTHDPKIDDPGLISVLPSEVFYIGALGSRKTQNDRRKRLRAAGIPETQLDRIHGPIGLDLGGRSPEEIAVAIMAEIIQTRHQ